MSQLRSRLRRRRRDIAVVAAWFVLANAVAVAWLWQAPRLYEASVDTYVATSSTDLSTSYLRGFFSLTRVQSYTALATSEGVLQDAVSKVAPNMSVTDLAKHVTASVIPQTVVLRIAVQADSPQRARSLATAVARAVAARGNELEQRKGDSAQVRLTVLSGVATSNTPVSPVAAEVFTLAELTALVLSLLSLAALRLSRERVGTGPHLASGVGLPTLGMVRQVSTKDLLTRQFDGDADSVDEQFRILRTQLKFALGAGRRSLVVTSANAEERPSTMALGLARSLAEGAASVVLVDGDLRQRELTRALFSTHEPGLTDAVAGQGALRVFDPSTVSPLSVVGAGQEVPSPTDLLDSASLSHVLEELERDFDYVVIAVPPLEGTADATLWAHRAGATVVVARSGTTKADDLAAAVDRLRAARSNTVGVVLIE